MNLYESIDSNLSEQPKVFEKGPQVYSGTVQEVIEKVPVEGIKKVLEALRPEVQVKVVYNEEQNTLKVETEYFTAWDGEIPEVKESDESIETQELDERIKLTLMNPIPDDNFRIYYKDDEGNLYCDLFGDLYDCTKQGEPIDKVDASKFILDGIEEVELDDEPKIDTKEEAIDFLKGDENEAIEGYEKVLTRLDDYELGEDREKYEKVLNHIIEEEKEHLEELEKLLNGEPIEWLETEVKEEV